MDEPQLAISVDLDAHPAPERFDSFGPVERRYLFALARVGIQTQALVLSHVSHTSLQQWRRDPAFVEAERVAHNMCVDNWEQKILRRGIDGYQRGVWYKGERVGEETHYSDLIALAALNAHRPERYTQSGAVTVNTQTNVVTAPGEQIAGTVDPAIAADASALFFRATSPALPPEGAPQSLSAPQNAPALPAPSDT